MRKDSQLSSDTVRRPSRFKQLLGPQETAEIGHVVARHPAEQISSKTVQLLLSAFLQLLGVDPIWANTGTVYGVELRNSRAAEYEGTLSLRSTYDSLSHLTMVP